MPLFAHFVGGGGAFSLTVLVVEFNEIANPTRSECILTAPSTLLWFVMTLFHSFLSV